MNAHQREKTNNPKENETLFFFFSKRKAFIAADVFLGSKLEVFVSTFQ